MNNDYCVYKHTTPNGMVYIGITNQEPEERWLNGRGYKQNPSFFNAILLYGWANIKHEIICSGISKETASQKEKELIQIYHSNESEHGFNSQSGGDRGFTHSADARKKISEASKKRWGEKEYREKVHKAQVEAQSREEVRKRKSEWAKKRYYEDKEYREKLHKSCKERMNNKEIKEAYREISRNRWEKPGYKERWHERMAGANSPSAKAIKQYALDGTLIKVYPTCKEAAEKTKTIRSGISACAKGKQKTAGGYIWRYANAN